MKKLTYSNIDSSNDFNLKNGELYINESDGHNLRLRVINTQYNQNNREYVEYLPSVLDSNVMNGSSDAFNVHLGNRGLRFAKLESDSNLFYIDAPNNQIFCDVELKTNNGVRFPNGDLITQNPIKWNLLADRNLTDTAVPIFTAGYSVVSELLFGKTEIMVVALVENEYVSVVVPTTALININYPATISVYRGSSVAASVTLGAASDTTYTVTSNADNVKVYAR